MRVGWLALDCAMGFRFLHALCSVEHPLYLSLSLVSTARADNVLNHFPICRHRASAGENKQTANNQPASQPAPKTRRTRKWEMAFARNYFRCSVSLRSFAST
uniref:Putative secreted protein n=1 Tax=Anopheles darlingi TaxID=43151 RepID=A0A2M4DD00_ANODA